MENAEVAIQCPNPNCQASNPHTHKFCASCGTPQIRRYLWAMADWQGMKNYYRVGELLDDRYLLRYPQIVLDTKPGLPPEAPEEIPQTILPYLKLFPYRLHLPQIYGYIPTPDENLKMDIWLLEYGTVPTDGEGELQYEGLLPELTQVWDQATPLQQLNWLWQIAKLWQPLQNQGCSSSLLQPALLRVNGSLVQLLELEPSLNKVPSFKQLGKLWHQWIATASPLLTEFLQQLCQHLQKGRIRELEQLITVLEYGMFDCGRWQERTYQIYTCTDTGPSRDHNEDACYPSTPELVKLAEGEKALTIVCDGIGGQEGGEIASQLAIDTLLATLETTDFSTQPWHPHRYTEVLEQAICTSNDLISERNDEENRRERQRMGTTLVMNLAHAHKSYVAHVGDSRVYYLTPNSCHQVTVDDDLASREVRLGYILYRDAIQYPNSGALVQALGMTSSRSLHPTVQSLILDRDCVFLLCSDGLSDFDRVEQYWESEIVPIFDHKKTVAEVGKRLLDIANQQNGHDNATVALLYCQVAPKEGTEAESISFPEIELSSPSSVESEDPEEEEASEPISFEVPSTELSPPQEPEPAKAKFSLLPWVLLVIALGGIIALLSWLFAIKFTNPTNQETPVLPTASPPTNPTNQETPPLPSVSPPTNPTNQETPPLPSVSPSPNPTNQQTPPLPTPSPSPET
jgi:protein phosphatase